MIARRGDAAPEDPERLAETVCRCLGAVGSAWQPVSDMLGYLDCDPAKPSRKAYQEFVYFHPFVQRFLYGMPGTRAGARLSPFTLFRRCDLSAVTVTVFNDLRGGRVTLRFEVARLHLYVTPTGTVILVLELKSPDGHAVRPAEGGTAPMTLADAQAVMDYVRRAYPPYWIGEKETAPAGKCPASVTLHWAGQSDESRCEMPLPSDCVRHVRTHRAPPVADHWKQILAPLHFPGDGAACCAVELRHVLDERMPVMTLIGVPDPRAISPGDWVRLAYVDDPGASAFPYGRAVLNRFEEDHCYDYFWDEEDKEKTTRHLLTSYSYAMVGKDDGPKDWSFLRDTLQDHFRRHYFQLALIANFNHAALLTLSDRLSQAVDRFGHAGQRGRALRDAVHAVQRDILQFTHRYWFEEVTNQLQGRHLFGLWRRHLDTPRLFEQVNREAVESDRFLQAEEQGDQTRAAGLLNRVGAVGLGLALATGVLGMNVLVPDVDKLEPIGWRLFALVATAIGCLLLIRFVWLIARHQDDRGGD